MEGSTEHSPFVFELRWCDKPTDDAPTKNQIANSSNSSSSSSSAEQHRESRASPTRESWQVRKWERPELLFWAQLCLPLRVSCHPPCSAWTITRSRKSLDVETSAARLRVLYNLNKESKQQTAATALNTAECLVRVPSARRGEQHQESRLSPASGGLPGVRAQMLPTRPSCFSGLCFALVCFVSYRSPCPPWTLLQTRGVHRPDV